VVTEWVRNLALLVLRWNAIILASIGKSYGGGVPNELIADSDSSPICKSIDE
jgi:hypothetical protein